MKTRSSRADIRVLTLLSLIEGAVLQASVNADPMMFNKIQYVKQHCQTATNTWKVMGEEVDTIREVLIRLKSIQEEFEKIWWLKANPEMNVPGMIYISMQLLDDLMSLVKQPVKSRALQNIFDGLTLLVDKLDPEGAMTLTQERATEVTTAIYSVVGER